jgi:DNA-binding transcriptional LysR family regulator
MMNRIALYHLETLLWIARLGTFSAAAERLNTTQPSVSARIKELERHLGMRLFRPEGRRMLLTVRGRQLVQQCEPLWSQLESTLLSTEAFSKASGIVKIGCGEIAATRCLPAFMAELNSGMPNVTFEVEIDLSINLRHKLEGGLLDFAMLVGPIDSPLLIAESIGKVGMIWLISQALATKTAKLGDSQDLPDLPVWSLSRPSHLYQVMAESVRQSKLKRRVINTCNHVRTLIDIIASGGGMGILPEALVRDKIKSGKLVPVSALVKAAPIEFFVVVRRVEDEPVVLDIFRRATKLRIE